MSIAALSFPRTPQVFFATYCDLQGVATVLDDGTMLFAAEGAHDAQGQLTLEASDPDLILAGHIPTADAQREEDRLAHPWYAAVHAVATRAKASLGDASHTRIEKATQIVLSGGVHLNDDHSAVVESQTTPLQGYAVNGSCPCPDFERAPAHCCKHRLAVHVMRRALELAAPPCETPAVTELLDAPTIDPEPVAAPAPTIDPAHIVTIQGKRFITYAGLLQLAHQRGLVSLTAVWTHNSETLSLAQAVAVFPFGTYTESGDAAPDNVTKKVAPHFRRVALTRSKARCLRDALAIDMCAVEELGSE